MPAAAPSVRSPLFNWLDHRAAGVLLHPTSLPSSHGVGVFDEVATTFLEFLAAAGFKYWQLCPLGPTGYGDSPYQCFSSFAGNPHLIDLQPLVRAGLVPPTALAPLQALNRENVDYGALYERKRPLLFAAHQAWRKQNTPPLPYGDFAAFRKRNANWLDSYALFSALKDHFKGQPWWVWPVELRTYAAAAKSALRNELVAASEAYAFIQFL